MKNLYNFLRMQHELQVKMKEANPTLEGSPLHMTDEEAKIAFLRWNHTALILELSEAMEETGWKPWASSNHINIEAFIHEMVDAEHFKLNMLLAAAALSGWSMEQVAREFDRHYSRKNAKNLQRQVEGYEGVKEKCPVCKRDLDEVPRHLQKACFRASIDVAPRRFCSEQCHTLSHVREQGEDMSMHDPDRVREMREDIDRRSGEGGSQSAEESAQAVKERHEQAQRDQGYEPKLDWGALPPLPPKSADPELERLLAEEAEIERGTGATHFPEVKTAESILAKARAQGEPVFVFRAKDFFSVMILAHYAEMIEKYGPDDADFHRDVIDHLLEFKHWQRNNVDKVRYPD